MAMAATTGSSSSSASAAAADKPAPALLPLTVKLDPTKYSLWLAQINRLLESRGLMSFVDGTAICPPALLLDDDGKPTNTTNPACESWIQTDQFVLSLINDSLSHFVVATLAGSISARATWVALQALLVGAAEQQPLLPTPVVDHSAAAVEASRGFGFDHLVSGEEMSGCGGGTTGEGVSGKKGLPGVKFFSPTAVELVHYLKNKILGNDSEFTDIKIPVIDHVCKHEPRDLPAVFFSQPDYINNKRDRCKRTTNKGKYNVTGKPREIKDELSKTVIGKKRYLSFKDNVPNAKKTKYVIHEYSLTETELAKLVPNPNQCEEFVLCCRKNKLATSSKRKNKTATSSKKKNKSANSRKLKDDSINGDELAGPAIVGKIASNSEDDQAAATDMIQGQDERLADKDVLPGTENRNEGADLESPNGFSPTDNDDISTCVSSPGGFDVGSPGVFRLSDFGDVGSPGGFRLSDFGDLFSKPSCADLGINMDSPFLPPQPPQLAQPPHSPQPHQPPPLPQPHQPPPPPQPHSSTLQSALCTKQGNFPGGYNDDCSMRQSPIGDDNFCLTHENNFSTNDHYEPVSNIAYSVQNGDTDERQHRLSEFDEQYLGVNMDSTFLPPQQLAATLAATPTSPTSPGSFVVGSPGGLFLSDFGDLYNEAFCADQPPHPLHLHQPPPAPHPHEPPHPPHPQNYCSSTLLSESCIKQGNVPSLYNGDCCKQLSPTVNNTSTNHHYEPVSNTAYCVQNGATDDRCSKVYKTSTNDHNESVSSEVEDNLGSLFDAFQPHDYTLLPPRNTELGDVMRANNGIDMQW